MYQSILASSSYSLAGGGRSTALGLQPKPSKNSLVPPTTLEKLPGPNGRWRPGLPSCAFETALPAGAQCKRATTGAPSNRASISESKYFSTNPLMVRPYKTILQWTPKPYVPNRYGPPMIWPVGPRIQLRQALESTKPTHRHRPSLGETLKTETP